MKVLYLERLRKSQLLQQDLAHYDRLYDSDTDKSLAFLQRCVKRQIELHRLDFNRNAQKKAHGQNNTDKATQEMRDNIKLEARNGGAG